MWIIIGVGMIGVIVLGLVLIGAVNQLPPGACLQREEKRDCVAQTEPDQPLRAGRAPDPRFRHDEDN